MKSLLRNFVAISLLITVFAQSLSGQGTQASITGTVTDNRGETLPGATVIVRNESTGFTAGTATNVNGEYTFRQLPLGSP